MRRGSSLAVHLVGTDEPTAALMAALQRLGPVRRTAAEGADLVVVGIDEAATHGDLDVWASGPRSAAVTVLAPPTAPDVEALDALRRRLGGPVVTALPPLHAPGLGRLLRLTDDVMPTRISVTVALPGDTSARHTGTACRFSAMALALTVEAPARPAGVEATENGAVVSFDGGALATVVGTTAPTPLTEIQVAGPAGTARLELAPGVRLERDGTTIFEETTDPLAGAGVMAFAQAVRAAATGRPGPPVRSGVELAREVLETLPGTAPPPTGR